MQAFHKVAVKLVNPGGWIPPVGASVNRVGSLVTVIGSAAAAEDGIRPSVEVTAALTE